MVDKILFPDISGNFAGDLLSLIRISLSGITSERASSPIMINENIATVILLFINHLKSEIQKGIKASVHKKRGARKKGADQQSRLKNRPWFLFQFMPQQCGDWCCADNSYEQKGAIAFQGIK